MDAFDWFHLLTPIALIIAIANLLTGLALKPEYRSARLKKYSLIGYCGLAIGWSIMRLGTAFTNVSLITKICLIGWLILMPALLLTASCFIIRITQSKLNFSTATYRTIGFIVFLLKLFQGFITKIFKLVAIFFNRRVTHFNNEVNVPHETYGGPHVFDKPPKDVFGGENPTPQHDPFSPWSSR